MCASQESRRRSVDSRGSEHSLACQREAQVYPTNLSFHQVVSADERRFATAAFHLYSAANLVLVGKPSVLCRYVGGTLGPITVPAATSTTCLTH